jgi:hypothetical protein
MLAEDEGSITRVLEGPGRVMEEFPGVVCTTRFALSLPLHEPASVVRSEYGKSGACGREGMSGFGDEEARGGIVGVRFRATGGG